MAVVLNKEQIMEIIPHRDPFLLIDEVNELEVGKRVKATKYIKAEDFWFKDISRTILLPRVYLW